MTQFIPHNGVYVVARQLDGKACLTIINGQDREGTFAVKRYAEIIGKATTARDVITGATIDLTKDLALPSRATLIIEF